MKQYIIAVCMILGGALYATSNQEYYLRGNKLYEEGAYQDALTNYERIEKKGNGLWHNMGNCCYYLERYDDARVYWHRAQRSASYDDYCALATNIALLDAPVANNVQTAYESWIFWVRARTASVSLLFMQLLTLCIWFLLFFALRRRWHAVLIIALIVMSIVCIWLSIDMQQQRCQRYAITKDATPMYVGPNDSYHEQGSVPHARSVRIIDERDGWYKIAHKKLAGWVQADKLTQV